MLKEIKKSHVKSLLPYRDPNSHKGQNGKVLIVGGSMEYYGAPVLAGLSALHSGADLVYLYVPEVIFDPVRSMYPDFIVKKYPGEYLTEKYAEDIVEFGKKCDSVLIGPGIGNRERTQESIIKIIENLHIPTVLDADAINVLKKINKFPLQQNIVVTPHQNEFNNLIDREIKVDFKDSKSIVLLRSIAMDLHINILLKSHIDYVTSFEGHVLLNRTGNAGMTVGGSGDVLAGIVASMMAQGLEGYDAAKVAAYYCGKTGEILAKQKAYNFLASDLAKAIPYALS